MLMVHAQLNLMLVRLIAVSPMLVSQIVASLIAEPLMLAHQRIHAMVFVALRAKSARKADVFLRTHVPVFNALKAESVRVVSVFAKVMKVTAVVITRP